MTKLLNTYEQADFERLAAFYPYRDEHGLTLLISSTACTELNRNEPQASNNYS